MPKRPTLQDLAHEAGLGTATVDRALNARGNVSRRSLAAVIAAAQRIGYPLPAQLDGSERRDRISLGFVLHKRTQAFYQRFADEIAHACAAFPDAVVTPHLHFSPSQAPDDFAEAIRAAAADGQAVAATAINHPSLTRLVEDLSAAGTSVFLLLNDFGGRAGAGYFGLDNMKAGRLAGWMMATQLQRPCRVAVIVGGARWHGQGLRETGFRTALREHAPQIAIADTGINLETRRVTYEATLDLLQRHTDLAGLYVAGGGMEGAIAALRESRPPGKLSLIVNELTPESRTALADRYVTMVIATPLREMCAALVRRMVDSLRKGATGPAPAHLMEPLIYLPDSL